MYGKLMIFSEIGIGISYINIYGEIGLVVLFSQLVVFC